MIIECKKRAEGYKPVKGNEKEIINHLVEHNYNYWDVEKHDKIISFYIDNKIFFTNDDASFFKYESDGRINIVSDRYDFVDYIAIPFSITSQDMIKILQAQNFVSLDMESDGTIDTLLKKWKLKTTTKTFAVNQNDILIFNTDWEIVDCLRNDKNQLYRDILEANDYIVERDD